MTLYVVAISKSEADALARMIGHPTRSAAEEHLRQVKAPPTDSYYAEQYKIYAVSPAPLKEGE